MSFKDLKIKAYQDSVSALPDYPSDAGITAAQLKAVFDGRTDKEIKQKFNALIDELITKFGLVEVDIADAVENHNQYEEAHERIITPIKTSIEEILLELLSMNIAIEGKADAGITETQLSALDLFISGTTNELHDHTGARNNPHEVTAEQVGLGNVDNTRDEDKTVFYSNESAYAAWAEEAARAYRTERDYNSNIIHETYATKDEVRNVDLSGYYTKTESDKKFVGYDAYNADMGYLDGTIGVNSDRIDQLTTDVGKIDTALDSIIAIQNELIGG